MLLVNSFEIVGALMALNFCHFKARQRALPCFKLGEFCIDIFLSIQLSCIQRCALIGK